MFPAIEQNVVILQQVNPVVSHWRLALNLNSLILKEPLLLHDIVALRRGQGLVLRQVLDSLLFRDVYGHRIRAF